jgi:hypothetical protein
MDLPTCPDCGQSVLDDDAEVCPFCGAAMSGNASKSVQKVAKQPEQPAPAPASSQPEKSKPASGSPKNSASDRKNSSKAQPSDDLKDLGLDSVIPSDAIQASPRQTKSRRFKVICPMCDATGYIPRNAASKEIKCPNRKCLSPIFKAPDLKKKEKIDTTGKKTRKNNSKLIIAASAGVILLFVIIAVAIILKKDPNKTPLFKKSTSPDSTAKTDNSKQENNEDPSNEKTEPVKNETVSNDVIINETINKLMPEYATSFDRNRSKAYCRRLSAIACALTGNIERANEELERFDAVSSSSTYEKIFPISEIVWQHLKNDEEEKALKKTDQLLSLIDKLPLQGHTAIDSATNVAAILVALDKQDEAFQLVKKYNQSGLVGQSLALIRKSQFLQDYNFDRFVDQRQTFNTRYPQWSTVTISLATHGFETKAENWALNSPNDISRIECLSDLIDARTKLIISSDQSDAFNVFKTQITSLPEKYHSILWARAATNAATYINEKLAKQLLDESYKALSKKPVPEEYNIPDKKQLAKSQLVLKSDPFINAMAALEIARVEHLLKQQEKSWNSIVQSLSWLKQSAASLSHAKPLIDNLNARGQQEIQNELKSLLELETKSTTITAFRIYRNNCKQLFSQAEERYSHSIFVLSKAISWNLESEVLEDIKDSDEYKTSDLFLQIQEKSKQNGKDLIIPNTDPDNKIEPSLHLLKLRYLTALQKDDAPEALKIISKRKNSEKPWKAVQFLAVTSKIAREKNIQGFGFLRNLHDPITKEISIRLYTASLSANGFATEAWNFCQNRQERLSPTERISGLLGIIEGILASGG